MTVTGREEPSDWPPNDEFDGREVAAIGPNAAGQSTSDRTNGLAKRLPGLTTSGG